MYAAPGRLRAPWRLAVFAAAAFVVQGIVEAPIAWGFAAISRSVGEPIAAYPWIMLAAVLGAIVVSLRVVDEAEWEEIAVDARAWRWRAIGAGWLLGVVVIGATAALLAALGFLRFTSARLHDESVLVMDDSWIGTAIRLLLLLAPAALWEELVFRGYLWRVAEEVGGARVALWSTSVAFGLVHLTNPGAGVRTTLLVMLAGVCLGTLRARTASVPAAWAAHLAWNWTMGAVLHVPVSGMPFAAPGYRAVISGPSWLTGGAWGPEGGLVAALVLGGALAVGHRDRLTNRRTRNRIQA